MAKMKIKPKKNIFRKKRTKFKTVKLKKKKKLKIKRLIKIANKTRGKLKKKKKIKIVQKKRIAGRTYVKQKKMESLINKGKQRGFLTLAEIFYFFPGAKKDKKKSRYLYNKFQKQGIEIIKKPREFLEIKEKEHKPSIGLPKERLDPIQSYLKDIDRASLISAEKEKELAKRIEKGDTRARFELIQANLRLVISIAKRYINSARTLTLADLIQEGNIGLSKAVDKFDWRRNYKFSTYGSWWITQAITRAMADQSRTIRIPVHMVENILKYNKVKQRLLRELDRKPVLEEIAAEMEISMNKARYLTKVLEIYKRMVSLEKPIGEKGDTVLGDFIEDKKEIAPFLKAARLFLREKIKEVLRDMTLREQRIIAMRFGLKDGVTYTLEEVGKEFGITRERIRQIEAKVLEKIRKHDKVGQLEEYITS